MEQNKTAIGDLIEKKYRIIDRFLTTSGALEWPLFLTIDRRVQAQRKTVSELTEEALLRVYAPVGVLVDQRGNIHYVHGHTGLFLEPAQGYAGVNNVLKMARKKLRRDLNTTLYQAVTTRSAAASPIVLVKRNGETMRLKIRVIPLLKQMSLGQDEDFYLICFEQPSGHSETPAIAVNQQQTHDFSAVSRELGELNQKIEAKTAELSRLNTELDNTRMELEISRNKLHAVKATIYGSETDLQVLTEKIRDSKDALEILGEELQVAGNVDVTDVDVTDVDETEIITLDQLPIREELDTIKNDLRIANQALEDKKELLQKLDSGDQIPAGGDLVFNQEAIVAEDMITPEPIDPGHETPVETPENSDYQPDHGSFQGDPSNSAVNQKAMGFFSTNEPKPFGIKSQGHSFGNEPDLANGMPAKNELFYKDASEFTTAASHGYRHDNEIKSVIVPEGVEVIKRSMFYKCTQLETVTFPSTLKTIEDFAFYGCEALKTVDLSPCKVLELIGTSAFEGCRTMTKLLIPDAVIEIEEAAFLGCQGMEAVEFYGNSQLEILGSHVFKDCVQLNRIILPDQLKQIGISCFYGCQNLAEIHLPRDLEIVGEYAFFGCKALEKIDFTNKKILKQPGFSVGFPEGVKI